MIRETLDEKYSYQIDENSVFIYFVEKKIARGI